jgi:hypothetical protein
MATKKRAQSAQKTKNTAVMPKRIFAQVSPLSAGGMSMFDAGGRIDSTNFMNFFSETSLSQRTAALLAEAGFEVLQITGSTINIAGSQKTYEEAFNTKLTLEQRTVIKPVVGEDLAEFVECPSTDMPGLISARGTKFEGLVEGVALEEPRYYMASSFAPPKAYWHLSVPAGVSLGCNADRAHRSGITGKGIKVVMTDSGWFKHPFFVSRGYRASPVVLGPGAANPLRDESGHGTGESANVFAVAPDADFTMVKMNFANTKGAFDAAVALNPHIISCSWGSSVPGSTLSAANTALATSIAAAVAAGIIVVVSAGNGHWGFPGMHPDVISAGGVFMNSDESLRASDYSSGFISNVYPGRKCPDLSGLVGMRPGAMYIMLPVEPNDDIDRGNAGGTHPNGDETATNDGWAAFSGTSAAAPQLAGAAALLKQACPRLKPNEVRSILMSTARDVTVGRCHPNHNHPAGPGFDLATGAGLVDAHKATLMAKVRCLRVVGPITPPVIGPPVVGPPVVGPGPVLPPPGPITPITPITPPQPVGPGPIIGPTVNPQPVRPASEEAAPTATGPGLSDEDINALQDMIIKSEVDQLD